jgi:NAD(P)-dependent dehydrogenase (short-subunit alcohol dehydrogenase family)
MPGIGRADGRETPIAGVNASVSMITKGGLNAVTRSLAIEYTKDGIRFNAVAPASSRPSCISRTQAK